MTEKPTTNEYATFRTQEFFSSRCGDPIEHSGDQTVFLCPRQPSNGKTKPHRLYVSTDGAWCCHHANCPSKTGCPIQGGGPRQFLAMVEPTLSDPEAFEILNKFGRSDKGCGKPNKPGKAAQPKSKKVWPDHQQLAEFWRSQVDVGDGVMITGSWMYQDASGRDVAIVFRFDGSKGKTYRQARKVDGGWVAESLGDNRPLYRLKENKHDLVLVVEGEKSADALRKVAGNPFKAWITTPMQGAKSPSKSDWGPVRGKSVVILPDHDTAGERFAQEVVSLCRKAGAVSVRIAAPFYGKEPDDGRDVADWLAEGGEVSAIIDAINNATEANAAPTLDTKAVPKVLGYTPAMDLVFWHRGRLHIEKARSLRGADLTMLTGIEDPDALKALKAELIRRAHEAGPVDPTDRMLPGAWKTDGRWIVVSGKRAAEVKEGKVIDLDRPVVDGRIIEHGDDWLDWDSMAGGLADGRAALAAAFEVIRKQAMDWCWRDSQAGDYASAFIMLTLVQQAMEWRPFLHVTGPRGCGKSSLFELVLAPIFGGLTRSMGKSTAHAIAQEVGNSGRALILDEFEQHKHVGQVLAFLKGSSSREGGTKTSGTPGARAHTYRVHHLPWIGSIYIPTEASTDAAIRDRTIRLELARPGKEKPKPIGLTKAEGRRLAALIVGGMISCWEPIEEKREEIRANGAEVFKRVQGSDHRTLDNYCHASAVLAFLTGKPYSVPTWAAKEDGDDGDKIMEAILGSKVRVLDTGREYSVGEILEVDEDIPEPAVKALARDGVKATTHDGQQFIAIKEDLVRRNLLRGSAFENLDIAAPLLRIQGARRGKVKMATKETANCILIPSGWNLWNLNGTSGGTSKTLITTTLNNKGSKGSSETTEKTQGGVSNSRTSANLFDRPGGACKTADFSGTFGTSPANEDQERAEEVPPKVPGSSKSVEPPKAPGAKTNQSHRSGSIISEPNSDEEVEI